MSQASYVSRDELLYILQEASVPFNLPENVLRTLVQSITLFSSQYQWGRIPREEAMAFLSQQIEVTRSGYRTQPVGIVEFIESPYYMNQKQYIRPAIMEHLVRLFEDEARYWVVSLGGAIGIGKNYFADLATAYILYKMYCLYSPQAYFGLAPGSEIVFVHQSKTLQQARRVIFTQFANKLRESPFFMKNYRYSSQFTAELHFPNNVSVIPVSGSDSAALGMNVLSAILDELNYMKRIKKPKEPTIDDDMLDQAEKLYTVLERRMKSRYMEKGQPLGKLFLISSANYEGDFIDRKEKEAQGPDGSHIFVMHLSQWEAFPPEKWLGPTFWIRPPSETSRGFIVEDMPEKKDDLIEIPIEFKLDFEKSMVRACRDLAGIPVSFREGFIFGDAYQACVDLFQKKYKGKQIFSKPSIVLQDLTVLEEVIDMEFIRKLGGGPFGAHLDLGLTMDLAGIAIGTIVGSKDIGTRTVFDTTSGVWRKEAKGELPVYAIVGLLSVHPEPDGEVDLNTIRDLIFCLHNLIGLRFLTADRFESAAMLQAFRKAGIPSDVQSVDRTPDPYRELRHTIREQRVWLPDYDPLRVEMDNLEQDRHTGKVDHREGFSKDLADAVAAVVFTFSRKKASYLTKPSEALSRSRRLPIVRTSVEGLRGSTGRPPLY